ncbi:MAG: HD-GYP domain-containing protein [Lachnospiraceae bacterium]|nr:HD-GYP domain-containing protein [Lachnospiraceae bacterium]
MNVIQIMLHKVTLGMTLAEDVYKGTQLLIQKGTVIDNEVLNILRYSSIVSVAVYGKDMNASATPSVEPPKQTHSERIRESEPFKIFEEQFQESTEDFSYTLTDIATKNGDVDIDSLFESANEIMAGETNTYHLMDILSNIRYFDDSTYAHSLNVAMLANIFGRWLHMSEEDLKILTVAGMLHDIGKVLMPPEIIKKPGALTPEEYAVIKTHPFKGYQLLKAKNVDELICRAALLHHEKCDGSGYPIGLKTEKIHDVAKIITIVDIYEAMTANRCYRAGLCPFDVIRMFEDEGYTKYDPKYLLPFLQGISDTYLHNTVLLSDGRKGEIIMTNKHHVSRPSIMSGTSYIDLTHHPELKIVAIL